LTRDDPAHIRDGDCCMKEGIMDWYNNCFPDDAPGGFIPDAPPPRDPVPHLSGPEVVVVIALAAFVSVIGCAAGVLLAFAWEQWR